MERSRRADTLLRATGVTSYVSSIVPNGPGAAIFFFDNTTANARDIPRHACRHRPVAAESEGIPNSVAQNPEITSIRDVPNDQGGRVLVLWNPSDYDQPGGPGIREYTLWRRVITPFASEPLAPVSAESGHQGDGFAASPSTATERRSRPRTGNTSPRSHRAARPATDTRASTTADSSDAGISWNVFFVDATDAVNGQFYTSAVDSGYPSTTWLHPPRAPSSSTGSPVRHRPRSHRSGSRPRVAPRCTGARARPATSVSYRIHRGSTPGFEPGPGNQIASKPDTGYIDPDVAPSFYKAGRGRRARQLQTSPRRRPPSRR